MGLPIRRNINLLNLRRTIYLGLCVHGERSGGEMRLLVHAHTSHLRLVGVHHWASHRVIHRLIVAIHVVMPVHACYLVIVAVLLSHQLGPASEKYDNNSSQADARAATTAAVV